LQSICISHRCPSVAVTFVVLLNFLNYFVITLKIKLKNFSVVGNDLVRICLHHHAKFGLTGLRGLMANSTHRQTDRQTHTDRQTRCTDKSSIMYKITIGCDEVNTLVDQKRHIIC